MAKNVEMTQKPKNGLLHSKYVFMPIESKSLKTQLKRLKIVKYGRKRQKYYVNIGLC